MGKEGRKGRRIRKTVPVDIKRVFGNQDESRALGKTIRHYIIYIYQILQNRFSVRCANIPEFPHSDKVLSNL